MAETASFTDSLTSGVKGGLRGLILGALVGAAGGAVLGAAIAVVASGGAFMGAGALVGLQVGMNVIGTLGMFAGTMTEVVNTNAKAQKRESVQEARRREREAFGKGVEVGHNLSHDDMKNTWRQEYEAEKARKGERER